MSIAQDKVLTSLVRFHDFSRLEVLDLALASLGSQSHSAIQLIIITQEFTPDQQKQVERLAEEKFILAKQKRSVQLIDIPNPQKTDLRSKALNVGLAAATGEYLAFLDFDDVIEARTYTFLVGQLEAHPDCVLSSGKCVLEYGSLIRGKFEVREQQEPFSWGNSAAHFYSENFLPIHSFVLNRKKIKDEDLSFDENMDLSEDYAFLLKLASKYHFDFSGHKVLVARYRSFDNAKSSNPSLSHNSLTQVQIERTKRSEEKIKALKKALPANLSIYEVSKLLPKRKRISPLRGSVTNKLSEYPKIREKVVWLAGMFGIKPRKF